MEGWARPVYPESLWVAVLEKYGQVIFVFINFCAG